MELIWDELGPNMEGLFQMGRSGVVASLIAACERLHVNEHKVCNLVTVSMISGFLYTWYYFYYVLKLFYFLNFVPHLYEKFNCLFVPLWQCCQILAKTVSLADESSKWIVPRLLFLDSYFTFEDKSNWIWQSGAKMNVMGSLILQTIFRFNSVSKFLELGFFFPVFIEKGLEVGMHTCLLSQGVAQEPSDSQLGNVIRISFSWGEGMLM
jgi:nucleolar protein 9